jgi:hypothetical protein
VPDFLPADWPAPANIRALTTLRSGQGVSDPPFDRFNLGVRCGDDPAVVLVNRQRLSEALALPSEPAWLSQVHGTKVVAEPGADEPEADAAVSAQAGRVLAILTADCLPLLFCDETGSEIAAAHAGWRGLAAGVLEATVAAMQSPPHRLMAWLGPAAGPDAYEIGPEVREAFLAHDSRAEEAFMPTRPGHWRVDLYALARQRLADAGVERVFGGGLCTIGDPGRFYSHRRDHRTGRMASLIWRKA